MHKYANHIFTNMHFQNMHLYAFYMQICALYVWICIICWHMHKSKYGIICKLKYSKNMHKIWAKYAQNMQCPKKYVSCAFICLDMQKMQVWNSYAKYAKICAPYSAPSADHDEAGITAWPWRHRHASWSGPGRPGRRPDSRGQGQSSLASSSHSVTDNLNLKIRIWVLHLSHTAKFQNRRDCRGHPGPELDLSHIGSAWSW